MWCFCKVARAASGMADRRDRPLSVSCASSVPARASEAVA